MIIPSFAKRKIKQPLVLGSYEPNNKLLLWLGDEHKFTYAHCKCDLILSSKEGWMYFSNNAAWKETLYLKTLIIHRRCKGHGTKTMEMLKRFSDETQTPISLVCCPLQKSDPERLRNFYTRLGFKNIRGFYIYDKMEAAKKEYQVEGTA